MAPAAKQPTARKTGTRAVETRQVKLPPPVKDKNLDPELGVKNRIRDYAVGLRGLMFVEGSYGKNGKYTGDVYLMRLIFIDDEGKTMKPAPTINVTVYNKDQPWGKAQRIVSREMRNVDASKINSGNVADNTIACDKKSGELWVAFVRTDGPSFDPRCDMTVAAGFEGPRPTTALPSTRDTLLIFPIVRHEPDRRRSYLSGVRETDDARRSGRLIGIASLSSFVGLHEVSAYTASKAGVAGLTRALAVERAPHGLTVNAIAPGVFRTELNAKLLEGPRGQEFLLRTPMRRYGNLDELVGAAVCLASDASTFVTGQVLAVDGVSWRVA